MGKPFFTYAYGRKNELPTAKCNLEVHKNLVICSERPDNQGPSITNAVEHIATDVCEKFNIEARSLIWVEHYPKKTSEKYGGSNDVEHYNLVFFNMEGGGHFDPDTKVRFYNPRWITITPEMVELLRITHQDNKTAHPYKVNGDVFEYITKIALNANLQVKGSSAGDWEERKITKKDIDEARECDWITISK